MYTKSCNNDGTCTFLFNVYQCKGIPWSAGAIAKQVCNNSNSSLTPLRYEMTAYILKTHVFRRTRRLRGIYLLHWKWYHLFLSNKKILFYLIITVCPYIPTRMPLRMQLYNNYIIGKTLFHHFLSQKHYKDEKAVVFEKMDKQSNKTKS